jgi:hypothetical protein
VTATSASGGAAGSPPATPGHAPATSAERHLAVPQRVAGSEACPLCGTPLSPEQDWCLHCGAAARTRLAATPNWRAPIATIAVVAAIALGVLAAALVKLAGGSSSSSATTTTITTPAASTPATSTPVPGGAAGKTSTPAPGASTPKTSVPATSTPTTPGATTTGGGAATTRAGQTRPTSPAAPGKAVTKLPLAQREALRKFREHLAATK